MSGTIYQRGTVWWVAWYETVKVRGELRRRQKHASSGSERRSDAVTLLNTKIYESRHQKPRDVEIKAEEITYEQCRDSWLARTRKHAEVIPEVYKSGPLKGQQVFAGREHLDEFFAGYKMYALDEADLQQFQKQLRERGLGNGIDRAMASLRGMMNYAIKEKKWLRPEHLPRFPMLKLPRQKPEPIKAEYFEPLCDALEEPFKTGFSLAYHTGMRMSEVERLRWEHVQLHKRRLYFVGAKTFEYRYVPLLADTADLLAALKPGKPGDLVFSGFDDRTARARAWRRAAVAAGCGAWYCRQCGARLIEGRCAEHGELTERRSKYKGPEFCHTRHTAARNLTNRGVPLPRVMQALGHKTVPVHLGYNLADESDLDLIHELYDGDAKRGPQKVRVMGRKGA